MIAARATWGPSVRLAVGTGAQVVAVEFVEAGAAQAQFGGGTSGGELAAAKRRQQVADEGGGQTLNEL
jgi:hypothetical protein